MYEQQLARIQDKLHTLRNADVELSLFGAESHEYVLDPVWTTEQMKQFEQKWKVQLPEDYQAFLLTVGAGGAGPYYGLEKPEDGVYAVLGYGDELNAISDPCILTEAWNWDYDWYDDSRTEEEWSRLEHEYYDPKWSAGMLRISDFGCGVSMNLVVKGSSYGEIWADDRANSNGIYPDHYMGNKERLCFLDWYELWLDQSLLECEEQVKESNANMKDEA
ncbi:SMI1/KNR4 family protein [Paenibacillus sp. ACRSA]|uniref:SMI1/KNR4 family protein n=1 Tax=Paenibacillus sp. ACRSA TaxID=2918211 RepID=UPI001EF61E0D|nr:SMI1/KNR4 family protein [Paenibacillus sp. ACRSA]MCG7376161.1 SMI1/KNR4 family protein [Paenibacillus sp. ACRSA]